MSHKSKTKTCPCIQTTSCIQHNLSTFAKKRINKKYSKISVLNIVNILCSTENIK